jgi:hypothetical protein
MLRAKDFQQALLLSEERIELRKFTAGLLGMVAVAASLIVLRHPRPNAQNGALDERPTPAGERVPGQISLERIRELGY